MVRAFLIALGFVAVTLPLTWFWFEEGRALYGLFFTAVAKPFYPFLGLDSVPIAAYRDRYINLIPFVGLMLVTPSLTLRRRLGGLVIGLLLLVLSHLLLNATPVFLRSQRATLPFAAAALSDALPFMIWFVLAREPLMRMVTRIGSRSSKKPRQTEPS